VKILGIDPGYATLGWSVISDNLKIIDYGFIETSSGQEIHERLFIIHNEINKIIDYYKPDSLAVEKLFFAKNTKTAIDVAKAIGVILLTARLKDLNFNEYTPLQVKNAITGYGRATKDQMQNMVMKIYNLKEIPHPDDAADALAIAACHSLSRKNLKIKNL
jgi:crossover junction endodeoxyribonuclease RuvC